MIMERPDKVNEHKLEKKTWSIVELGREGGKQLLVLPAELAQRNLHIYQK